MAHALTGFGVIYAGKLWLEHEIAAALVSELLFLASASGWAVSVIALYRTLEGHGPRPHSRSAISPKPYVRINDRAAGATLPKVTNENF